MKRLLSIGLCVALLFAASTAAVDLLHDRETVVPPPDSVAEQFIRAVMCKRYEPARQYLLDPDSVTREQLESLQSRLGEGANPEAEIVSRDDEQATVTVRVEETTIEISLEWDREWKVAELP